jgi:hypothetical protein
VGALMDLAWVQRGDGGLGRQRSGAWGRARRQPPMAHGGDPADGVVLRSLARNGGGHLNRHQGMGSSCLDVRAAASAGVHSRGHGTDRRSVGRPSGRPAHDARRGKPRGGLGTARGFGERAAGSTASLGALPMAWTPRQHVRAGVAPALAARHDVAFQRDALRCRLV